MVLMATNPGHIISRLKGVNCYWFKECPLKSKYLGNNSLEFLQQHSTFLARDQYFGNGCKVDLDVTSPWQYLTAKISSELKLSQSSITVHNLDKAFTYHLYYQNYCERKYLFVQLIE